MKFGQPEEPTEDGPLTKVVKEVTRVKYLNGNIPVIYTGLDLVDLSMLPPYLATRPMTGDIVEDSAGNRVEVKEFTHIIDRNVATVKLMVGKPTGGTSVSPGGGNTAEDAW